MFQERNQSRRDRNDLTWRHVDVVHPIRQGHGEFILVTTGHQVVSQLTILVEGNIGLRNHILTFLNGGQVINVTRHLAVNHLAVWCFQEAVIIGTGVHGQGVDQTNVWTFRRFDRTDATIVRRMHVTDFETGAFTRQTTRAQGRYTALMRHFGKRIILIHKLG